MSLASAAWEPAQALRVTRTFLEVVEIADMQPRVRTMPDLPSLGFDLEEEPATGYAVLAEPRQEPDQDQRFVVRESRTFLEFIPDVTTDDEMASQGLQGRSMSMSILPSFGLDFEKGREKADSFGAFLGQEASEPIPRGTPIFHPNLAVPAVGMTSEMASVAMAAPHWPEPLLPGLVVHPHGSADMGGDVERIGEVKAVGKKDEGEKLKLVPQHADRHSGPFPLRMVEQHNNGCCYPCLFFTRSGDGCRMGDDCTHCHVCRPHEIRRRRNRIAAEIKAAKKAAGRRQRHEAWAPREKPVRQEHHVSPNLW